MQEDPQRPISGPGAQWEAEVPVCSCSACLGTFLTPVAAAFLEGLADSGKRWGLLPEPGPGLPPVSAGHSRSRLPYETFSDAPLPAGWKNPDTSAQLSRPAIAGFYFCSCILGHSPFCAPLTSDHLQLLPSTLNFPVSGLCLACPHIPQTLPPF